MSSDTPIEDSASLRTALAEVQARDPRDLSSDQDLVVALMNLISIEEHLFFTGAKTGHDKYYELLDEVRSVRKDLLKQVVVDYEGEVWCISKHLLAASMRLMEVGTKQLSLGHREQAKGLFDQAYGLYSLFWGVNLQQPHAAANAAAGAESTSSTANNAATGDAPKAATGWGARLRELVSKIVNCCIE